MTEAGNGFYSAYVLDEIESKDLKYSYFQCVTSDLYNTPETVFKKNDELFETLENITSPFDCLKDCVNKKHEMAWVKVRGPTLAR